MFFRQENSFSFHAQRPVKRTFLEADIEDVRKHLLIVTLILIALSEAIHAAGKSEDPKSSQTFVGLGTFGYPGEVSCTDCKVNPPPEGYFPKHGMFAEIVEVDTDADDDDIPIKPNKKKSSQKSSLSQADSLLSTLVDNIPDKSLQSGLKEYLKVVNPKSYRQEGSVGSSNAGIVEYFQSKFSENQCFQNGAADFYRDVETTLKKTQFKCEPKPSKSSAGPEPSAFCSGVPGMECPKPTMEVVKPGLRCFKNRPSINDRVGQGSKSHLDEGWLMRLAMKHAKGSPEAALEIIGMCGHDDTSQGKFSYYDRSEAARAKNLEQVAKFKEQKKALDDQLKKAFQNYDVDQKAVFNLSKMASFAANQIVKLSNAEGRKEQVSCPPTNSDFYVPGSISGDADISSALKEKIRTIQGDGKKDASFIPAKHYHVYGSALLGCKMAQNGVKPEQATMIQKQAARFYRGLRMCNSSRDQLRTRDQLKAYLQVKNVEDSREIEAKLLQIWEQKNKGEFKCEGMFGGFFGMMGHYMMVAPMMGAQEKKPEKDSSRTDRKTAEKCTMLMTFGVADLEANERAVVLKKASVALGRLDAAKLYDSWYLGGGSIAGFKIPCTDHRNKGPSDLMKPNESFMGKLFKPSGWSDERYNAASKRLATWEVDFEWTIAQHEAGSKYGAKICSEAKNKKNPFEEPACLEKKSRDKGSVFGLPAFEEKSSSENTVQ